MLRKSTVKVGDNRIHHKSTPPKACWGRKVVCNIHADMYFSNCQTDWQTELQGVARQTDKVTDWQMASSQANQLTVCTAVVTMGAACERQQWLAEHDKHTERITTFMYIVKHTNRVGKDESTIQYKVYLTKEKLCYLHWSLDKMNWFMPMMHLWPGSLLYNFLSSNRLLCLILNRLMWPESPLYLLKPLHSKDMHALCLGLNRLTNAT